MILPAVILSEVRGADAVEGSAVAVEMLVAQKMQDEVIAES
jgi:hypothetical protein